MKLAVEGLHRNKKDYKNTGTLKMLYLLGLQACEAIKIYIYVCVENLRAR